MSDFKKELIKIGISAAVGLILGIVLYTNDSTFLIISPFYGIGVVYGWREIFGWASRVLGAGAEASLWSLFFRSGTAGMISLMLMVLGIAAVLMFGWVIGIIRAALILFESRADRKNLVT